MDFPHVVHNLTGQTRVGHFRSQQCITRLSIPSNQPHPHSHIHRYETLPPPSWRVRMHLVLGVYDLRPEKVHIGEPGRRLGEGREALWHCRSTW